MNRKILVADDNKNILKAYKALFKNRVKENSLGDKIEEGFYFETFENGKFLLDYFKSEFEKGNRYSLCLLDMRMPVMDGLKTARELRKIDRDVIIIIVTAYSDVSPEGIKESLKEDIYYIRKPFKNEELYCLVDSLVKGWNKNFNLQKYRNRLQELVEERNVQLKVEINSREEVEKGLMRLFTAIEQTGESIVITDDDGKIQFVNPAFERVSGYEQKEVVGEKPSLLKSGEHDESFYKELWDTITSGKVWAGHFINKKKSGAFYEVDASISPVMGSAGKITNYVSVTRDVTDKIKLERQLRQAQKMEAIGTLAGGIAHDFNNILTSVLIFTELAMEKSSEEGIKKYLKEVLKAGHRAADLASQILAFSRQKEQKKQPVEVKLIVKEVFKLLKASVPSTIQIKQDIQTLNSMVLADPTSIHQVIMNLCTNASHAMKETGGVIKISLSDVNLEAEDILLNPSIKPGAYLKLTVSDTGPGIENSIIDRIFEPYFTTKKPGEGTGLGLAVVHGIVKSNGGKIKVYSEPGEGTTFHVYLPKSECKSIKETEPSALLGGRETILVVDDEQPITLGLSEILKDLGYKVTALTSPLEACELFQKDPEQFDLLITDQTMPDMIGVDLAQRVLSVKPHMPVILCTGFSEVINSKKVKDSGIKEVIMKPLTRKKIAEVIRRVLERYGSAIPSDNV